MHVVLPGPQVSGTDGKTEAAEEEEVMATSSPEEKHSGIVLKQHVAPEQQDVRLRI